MNKDLEIKFSCLKTNLRQYKSAVIAFSGGVDSTFLAKIAKLEIPKVLLITATSATYPEYELKESKELARLIGLDQKIIVSEELEIEGFSENPPDRCFYCKSELFGKISKIAKDEGYEIVFDGSNLDDLGDYRPGRKALAKYNIISPLLDSKLTKADIRALSTELNLPTAKKAPYACLASRFPYGETISREKLTRVGEAELLLRQLGLNVFRVRSHENLARIEVAPEEIELAWKLRNQINAACKKVGFTYVALDLQGYRTGAMNEVLMQKE